ncbi:MAG: hypothetical protein E3K32_09995 [wastewater metagenome]|nr:hypothetical protein [Candidatus Loosdrechtia aerotolerans]
MEDDDAMSNFYERTRELFTREELLLQVKNLLSAHKSNNLFRLTDYHFLILHDVIYQTIELHNDLTLEGESIFDNLDEDIDFDTLIETFFWDEDFLVSSDIFDELALDTRKQMGFNEEIFSIVYGLKPHPCELRLEIINTPYNWEAPNIYRPGETYPFIEE